MTYGQTKINANACIKPRWVFILVIGMLYMKDTRLFLRFVFALKTSFLRTHNMFSKDPLAYIKSTRLKYINIQHLYCRPCENNFTIESFSR